MRGWLAFVIGAIAVVSLGALLPRLSTNAYILYAGFTVLQYVAIATGWNILGGYAGYVNFGSSAFLGAGVYTAAFAAAAVGAPLLSQIVFAAIIGGCLGLAMGYLTLRIQGVYFSIATLALTVVLNTLVVNWAYVGGARGISVIAPAPGFWFPTAVGYVFFAMVVVAVLSLGLARWIERSWIGRGLAAIRADEVAAECAGVPTLRLKLLAATISGAVIAMAGAPYPYYASYVDPNSVFSISFALNALAMPLIGGTRSWIGPVVGALLLSAIEQLALVTVSAELNLLVVGLTLIGFVIAAPGGLLGLAQYWLTPKGRR